jgi:hypothetical protein
MNYVKTSNQMVAKYPYSIGDLRKDNRHISFPKVVSGELLASYNVFPVSSSPIPEVDYTKVVREGAPKLVDGVWVQVWDISDATSEEIEQRLARLSDMVRRDRNTKLSESDWTQVGDTPLTNDVKLSWATYRQALRDITSHVNFPHLEEADWPVKP